MSLSIKLYGRKGIDRVIADLIDWVRVTENNFQPAHFVKKHPWTAKFFEFTKEAVEFRNVVNDSDLIWNEDKNDLIEIYRIKNNLPKQIRIRVSVREIRTRRDVRTFLFIFEEVKPGAFKCVSF
jgi:hypothetical protein